MRQAPGPLQLLPHRGGRNSGITEVPWQVAIRKKVIRARRTAQGHQAAQQLCLVRRHHLVRSLDSVRRPLLPLRQHAKVRLCGARRRLEQHGARSVRARVRCGPADPARAYTGRRPTTSTSACCASSRTAAATWSSTRASSPPACLGRTSR
uniref:Transposase n=1 Tax=Macrostomum lignano TaxID=282301 RepID=A0A1I8FLL8_9PLAT